MRLALVPAVAALALVSLAGCNVAKPAAQTFHTVNVHVSESPSTVVERIQREASADGHYVSVEDPYTVLVDFGTETMRVPVPTEYGLWGTRVTFRDTAVASSSVYHVTPAAGGGSHVRMSNNPVYYHPDIGVWLPGPYDLPTGAYVLDRAAADEEVVIEEVIEIEEHDEIVEETVIQDVEVVIEDPALPEEAPLE